MAGAASPQSAEVPRNVGRTSSQQPPSSMTETATQPDGAGKPKDKGNERTNMEGCRWGSGLDRERSI